MVFKNSRKNESENSQEFSQKWIRKLKLKIFKLYKLYLNYDDKYLNKTYKFATEDGNYKLKFRVKNFFHLIKIDANQMFKGLSNAQRTRMFNRFVDEDKYQNIPLNLNDTSNIRCIKERVTCLEKLFSADFQFTDYCLSKDCDYANTWIKDSDVLLKYENIIVVTKIASYKNPYTGFFAPVTSSHYLFPISLINKFSKSKKMNWKKIKGIYTSENRINSSEKINS